ncbi:helix-turn-helix domain-containing protein [Sinomonas sp. P10A9]|uniref:Helix-turn-helix domain-containing protein n=1 Tax=Sinomonas puerhi TaxID=3238584 RepID=A0AB39L2F7_9MICC
MELDQWIRWALAADLPSSRAIGQHAVGRVLVALAVYANRDGIAWPSTYTLADDVSGLSRRDVRNALEALEASGVISKAGKAGRATRWHLNSTDEQAGNPADRQAGEWAGEQAGNQAGEQAGEWAGGSAGYPAPNRTEEKRSRRRSAIADEDNPARANRNAVPFSSEASAPRCQSDASASTGGWGGRWEGHAGFEEGEDPEPATTGGWGSGSTLGGWGSSYGNF